MIGRRVGNVRIDALLGEGGMGTVYQGFDEDLRRTVAVKRVRSRRSGDDKAHQRFRHEARLLSRLEHPNICRVYGLLSDDDADYMVMELIEGRTLTDLAGDHLDTGRALFLFSQVAAALAAVHSRSVVHRDVKPDNVMIDGDGVVKLVDFGIARILGERMTSPEEADDGLGVEDSGGVEVVRLTRAGAVPGTVRYMSPEQARQRELTEASDIYSLGIVLQEVLTGRPAYSDLSRGVLRVLVEGGVTVEPEGVEPEVADLLRRMTDLDPEARPSAADVRDLLWALQDLPDLRRRRRRLLRILISGLAVLAAVAVLALVFSLVLARFF